MKKRILVVDDDQQIREALAKVLQAEGYEVDLAGDGHEGLARFDPDRVDLLLLDLNLPRVSGWDLFERFSSLNPFVPIILITGRTNQYPLAAAAGVSALMEKPLDVPLLLQRIAELLVEPAENRLRRLTGLMGVIHQPAPARAQGAGRRDAG